MAALPTCFGVYAFVFPDQQVRRIGTSDIAYVGSAKNQGGLRRRIRMYFHPGYDNRTNIRMQQHMRENPALMIGCGDAGSKDRAKLLESDLLLRFEREHGELPPFNKQRQLARLWHTSGAG
jgi:hypothetical protein